MLNKAKKAKKIMKILSVFFLLLLSASLYAKSDNIRFKRISIEQGLSQSSVFCIIQDRKGFMWFGTQDGLNRYDGYDFKIYKHDPLDSTTISDNYIQSIYKDRAGVLWIGTWDGGLNKFDSKNGSFIHYSYDKDNLLSLSHNQVWSIYEDQAGVLWIGTRGGLNKFDRKTGDFTRYMHNVKNPDSLSNNEVRCIYEDSTGVLWIGTHNGLNKLDRKTGDFNRYMHNAKNPDSLSNNEVRCIYEDSTGVLWIGTHNGLNKLDRKTGDFTRYTHHPADPNSLSNNEVKSIYEDYSGTMWIGTSGGLNKFDRKTGNFTRYTHDPVNPNSLSHNKIMSIFEDRSGVLWVGVLGGLNVFDRKTQHFTHFKRGPENLNSLSDNMVWSIYKDRSGVLWIGTSDGLNEYDPKTERFTHHQHGPDNLHSLSRGYVRCIFEDRLGTFWIGTSKSGLNKFDRKTGKFVPYMPDKNDPQNSLSHKIALVIYEDRKGELWIGTDGGGLNKFDRKTEKFTHYKNDPKDPHSLSDDRVLSIHEDRAGTLWVGTWGGGLNKLDRESGHFTSYQHDPDERTSLSHNRVRYIYEDPEEEVLWLGTQRGLNRFNPKSGRFRYFLEKDGLANEIIYGILEDSQGNLWMSTNKGISKFNPKTGKFKNYYVDDGLQSNEFNQGAYFRDKKTGEMFFGGINGFNEFSPEDIEDDSYEPPVVITNFLLFNKPVPLQREKEDSPLKKPIHESESLKLSYQDSLFSFEFAALHYSIPQKNRYKYKLEGYDTIWIETDSKNRRATYTRVPAGDYVFRVQGSNRYDIWNKEGTSIKLKILPPWWKTWWAYILYLLIFIAFVFLIWSAWSKRFLKKKVEQRTRELRNVQDQLIQQEKMASLGTLLAGIAHELDTPTATIKMNAEFFASAWEDIVPILDQQARIIPGLEIGRLPYKESREDINKLITGLLKGSRSIKNLINELKNFSRKDDTIKKEININEVIRSSIDLTRNMINKTTHHFSQDLEEGLPVINGNFQVLEQVFINLIQNAYQALPDNIHGIYISSAYDKKKSEIVVKVKDEGVGIKEKHMKYITDPFFTTKRDTGGTGLGLSISLQIIQEHGGKLNFESEPGKGTTAFVHLPVKPINGEKNKC